jgi:hypothetical protein
MDIEAVLWLENGIVASAELMRYLAFHLVSPRVQRVSAGPISGLAEIAKAIAGKGDPSAGP